MKMVKQFAYWSLMKRRKNTLMTVGMEVHEKIDVFFFSLNGSLQSSRLSRNGQRNPCNTRVRWKVGDFPPPELLHDDGPIAAHEEHRGQRVEHGDGGRRHRQEHLIDARVRAGDRDAHDEHHRHGAGHQGTDLLKRDIMFVLNEATKPGFRQEREKAQCA